MRPSSSNYANFSPHSSARDARLLKMPANTPSLLSESINVNQNGIVIEYGVKRFRGDRMELVMEQDV